MDNDLISREALKEKFIGRLDEGFFFYSEVMSVIDNAPTVEINDKSLEIAKKSIELGRKVGKLEGNLERPQGEWEEPFEMNGKTYHKCNHCHISSQLILIDKFCPNCGAKMKGGDT